MIPGACDKCGAGGFALFHSGYAGKHMWCLPCKRKEREGRTRLKVALSGHFVLIHQGHLDYLTAAAKLGSLTVIVNNDRQIRLKYGVDLIPEQTRLELVRSLKMVDEVVLSIDEDRSVSKTVSVVCPDLLVQGGDVSVQSCRELSVCQDLGIPLVVGVGGFEKTCSASNLFIKMGRIPWEKAYSETPGSTHLPHEGAVIKGV